MTMAGRKTAFPAEDLLAITREYIGLNEGRKIGYSVTCPSSLPKI